MSTASKSDKATSTYCRRYKMTFSRQSQPPNKNHVGERSTWSPTWASSAPCSRKWAHAWAGAEPRIFIWGGQVAALIYLSKQPPTYTYTHAFFIIYTFFYLISYIYIYIYTHTKKKKKSLVFSIKIMFDGNFS